MNIFIKIHYLAGAGIGSAGGPIGAGVGAVLGGIFGLIKLAAGEDGCDESNDFAKELNGVQNKLEDVSKKIDDVGNNVQIGRKENKINHRITQDLVQVSRGENQINFEINRGLINQGRVENSINFAINRGLIQQGRQENLVNFARTQGLVNQGRVENQINFQKTQGLINQGRVENFMNFKETQGLINQGRHENLMNFALTQGLVNQGRAENQVNFAITRSLINRGREENQINFRVTQGLINQGRTENLINFGITQDLINQGRWENLMNFKAIQGSVAQLRDDTLKGFSFLSKQADRNLEAITIARLEVMQGFNGAYKLLDRNFDATNAGRVENLKNFEITKNLINRIGDAVIRNQAQAMAERMLFYTSTVNLIRESTNETISAIDDAKQKILRSIEKSRVEPILSKLTTFLAYFNGELEGIKSSNMKQILAKFQEPNGLLFYLTESRTPRAVNSLHSLLSDIINQGLAIPKSSEDELALITLDALFTGTQTYVSVLAFLMEAYSFLADHYYQEMDVKQFHSHITLINVRYNDFKRSLNDGIIDQVADILLRVERTGFVDGDTLFSKRRQNLEALREGIISFDATLKDLQTEPAKLQRKPEFPPFKDNVHGPWKPGRAVSYAIQYEFNNVLSKIGEFTEEFILAEGMANPLIHVPSAPARVTSRLVFRKFDDENPEYVGEIGGNKPTSFRDIDKDLFNAAGSLNEALAAVEVRKLLDSGANISATFEDEMTALHKASAAGNSRIVEIIIKAGADLNAPDLQGHKPIHHAAEAGYVETVRMLLSLGADANSKTGDDLTPLHIAALYGNGDVLQYLLTLKDINANAITKDTFTAIHLSVMAGHISATGILADNDGVNVNAPDSNFFSPLHHAVATENKEILKLLLPNARINANAKTSDDLTALHLAAISGNKDIVDMLLTQGNVNIWTQSVGGYTALHMAAANGHSQIVQSLLGTLSTQSPNLINSLSAEKWTPLHLAIAFKHDRAITQLLLHSNVDIKVKAEGGLTPLHLAAGTDQPQVVSKLILLGANLEEQSDLGLRAIHYAAWYGRKNAASVLLRQADINAKTQFALTPLHLAVIGNHISIVEQLTARPNLQIHSAAENGVTALHFAAVGGKDAILVHLLQHGAEVNAKDRFGKTALDMAIENEQKSTSNLLKLHGGKSSICLQIGDSNAKNKEGFTLLQVAAQKGDLGRVLELVSCGAKVDALSSIGSNALHEAAYFGRSDVVAALIDSGIDANAKKTDGWAAIHLSCLASDPVPTLRILLRKGVDVNSVTDDGKTALDIAIEERNSRAEAFLRSQGAKTAICVHPETLDLRDDEGLTKLHRAARDGRTTDVKNLISCGANVHVLSHIGSTALHEAAYYGRDEVIVELLKAGAKINQRKETVNGWAAIHLASLNGHWNTVNLLLKSGADINLTTLDRQTAIDVAVNNGQEKITSLLKQHGGRAFDCIGLNNLNEKDSNGWTSLHYAVHEGNGEKVKVLLKCGASQNIFSSIGSLPIHEAAFGGYEGIVRELLSAGVDPNVPKKDGATALHLAAVEGKASVIKALLEKGANANIKSPGGLTPLDYAIGNGHNDAANVLRSYGGIHG
ncbi:unnamed protein product [Darwinula stevensoni]|uniref:Uncharacterized protein n=1 Tax=Darwinula stevensoni TaxID=69355 RepID=A0A7R9AEU9_9CRUS|nr:unnamed protein product [Darwinula stevensoni]CAG0902443.1 unnamed protein product [Darwinula stevensoni]